MKRASLVCLFLFLTAALTLSHPTSVLINNSNVSAASPASPSPSEPKAQARILEQYGKLPLSFEANHGQTDSRVKFLSRTSGYTLFLTGDEAVLALSGRTNAPQARIKSKLASAAKTTASGLASPQTGGVLRMKLRNANPAARVTGVDELAGTSNYFIGNDPAKWRTNVPTYAKVKYEGIYSGIDLVYYGNQRQLEYDFIVEPGADPRRIALDVSGAKRIRRNAQGELVFRVGEEEIRWQKPVVYQERNGIRQVVAAHYSITSTNSVGFELARYDAGRPLYIDPLIYSTYLGGTGSAFGQGIAVDSAGNAYITGFTGSGFPTMNPLQATYGGAAFDAFVTKMNAEGSALIYSTYLGGSDIDQAYGIAVDSSGNAYVTGETFSSDFPTTSGAFQTVCNGGSGCYDSDDAFVTKINPSGSALVYSTFLGGSNPDAATAIAVDAAGNAYVTGTTLSSNFPTKNSLQPYNGQDAFVTKINPTGTALVYSTYLGGSFGNSGNGIAVDGAGNAYVTGQTLSTDFPTTSGAFQTVCNRGSNCANAGDGFVSEIDAKGSAFVYSTFLGGSGQDYGTAIAVDSAGDAYVTGATASADFPTKNPLQSTSGGGYDAFVTELNSAGTALIHSTYLGGSGDDGGYGIALDSAGNTCVIGQTQSANFPTMNPVQPATAGQGDAFVAKLSSSGKALLYSTYLGGSSFDYGYGIAIDSAGNAYVTGNTYSGDFPAINPLEPQIVGRAAAFVAKITADLALTPQVVNFGKQFVGTSNSKTSKLTNTGSSTLNIMSISVSGTDSGDFAQTNNCGTSVPVEGSCNITVTLTPSALGTRTGTVIIGDSAMDSPHTIGLTGVGISATTTTLTSAPNPSAKGQSVTLTAVVVPTQNGTPTGTVTFYDGATALGTVALSADKAVLKFAKLAVGSHSLTAAYSGDAIFQPSTSPVVTQAVKIPTATTLTSSPNPSAYGQTVTFTATVTSSVGAPPNGETVTFRKGSKALGTGTLSGGSASFATSTLPVGTNSITAVYAGDSNFLASTSKAVKQVVNKAGE